MAKTEIGTGKPGKREEGVRTKKAGRAVQEVSDAASYVAKGMKDGQMNIDAMKARYTETDRFMILDIVTINIGENCSKTTGDQGCNGGLPENKIQGMINTDIGPAYRDDHPYTARDDQCTQDAPKKVLFIQT